MADRSDEQLNSTSETDSRSSVVHNDQIITDDDQASSSQENVARECDSTNRNQEEKCEQNTVENCVTSGVLAVQHQNQTFEHQHQIGKGMVGLRQNAIDNTNYQCASDMVDRRQSTVESTDMDGMVNCQDKRNRTVDRNEATVEDTDRMSPEQQCPSFNQVMGATSTNYVVDHERSAFQDSQSRKTSNLINHQKNLYVGVDAPMTRAIGASQHGVPNTAQNTGSHLVGGGSTQLRNKSNTVDRRKMTVEDDVPSSHMTDCDDKIVDRKRATIPDEEEELWKIQLHISTECSENIVRKLPASKHFAWNKPLIFGRGEDVDIFINDDKASKNHVELIGQTLLNGQVVFMTRNRSTSKGFFLNGQYITNNTQWMQLNSRHQIQIAGLTFTVHIIPAAAIGTSFVLEFILPQFHNRPPVSPVMYSAARSNGQPSFYPGPNFQQPFVNPRGNFAAPHPVHGTNYVHPSLLSPTNGIPNMQPPWFYPPAGQPYFPGINRTNITVGMVEHALQPYQEREGYVKIPALPYLAREAVGEWKELGRALGLKDWQLTIIDRDNPGIGEKSYQMLLTWVWHNPEQATLENLKKALEDMTVGRGDLALKYCTSVQNNGTNGQNNDEENGEIQLSQLQLNDRDNP